MKRITSTNTRWRDAYGRLWRLSLMVALVLHAGLLLCTPHGLADRIHEALLPSPMLLFRSGGPGAPLEAVVLRPPAAEEPVQETLPEPEKVDAVDEVTPAEVPEDMTVAEVEAPPSEGEGTAEGVPEGSGATDVAEGGGGSVSPPRPLHLVVPRIPEGVDRKKARGQTVHLLVQVLPDGTVGEVRIEHGTRFAALDSVAAHSAREMRYMPATRHGTGVTQWTRYDLVFR